MLEDIGGDFTYKWYEKKAERNKMFCLFFASQIFQIKNVHEESWSTQEFSLIVCIGGWTCFSMNYNETAKYRCQKIIYFSMNYNKKLLN